MHNMTKTVDYWLRSADKGTMRVACIPPEHVMEHWQVVQNFIGVDKLTVSVIAII